MRFLGLASRNFKETYRDRLDVGLLLAIPIMLMLVFGVILRGMPFFVEELSFIGYMAPGVIVFGLLILVSASARLMAMDKETEFLSRLMTTPARPSDFLLGYSLGLVAIVIVQIIIYIVVGWKLGMSVAGSPLLLFLILFLTSLNCIAIGMIVGSLAKSKAQAESLSWLFLFPMVLISGAMFPPLEMMPSYIRNIAYAFPFARAIDAARGVNVKGLGLEALSNDLLFLAGFAVVFFTIGVILFRNCLVVSRIRSMFSYAMAVVILAGLLCFGFLGGDLRFNNHVSLGGLPGAGPTPEAASVSFPEDFEDGNADGWRLDPGWEVRLEDGNHVLSGASDRWSWASPKVSGWFNYTLESRVKLISGKFQLNFRTSEAPFRSRYILGIGENEFYLSREINGEYPNLTGGQPILELNEWHQLKIVLSGTNIKVYLDDELKLDYTDSDLPLIFGGFAFEVAPNSHALFDNINVQMTPAETTKPMPVLAPDKGRVVLDFPDLPKQITIRQIKDEFLIGVGTTDSAGSISTEILYQFRASGLNYFLPAPTWASIEVSEGVYSGNPCPGEDFIRRASKSGAVLNGHCLLFFMDEWWLIPRFAIGRSFEEQKDMIEKFVRATVRRFPEIEIWTLNEPIAQNCFGWSREQNYDVFVSASNWIHEVNPEAEVMINMIPIRCNWSGLDYDPNEVLDDLIERGLEADIIGIELYYWWAEPDQRDESGYPNMEWVREKIELFSGYNLPIIFSEVGVPGKMDSRELWEQQADWMEQFFRLCHNEPGVIGAVWYFVRDDPFMPYAGLVNDDYSLRPVGQRLLKLANEWNPSMAYYLNGQRYLDLDPGEYDVIVNQEVFRANVKVGELTQMAPTPTEPTPTEPTFEVKEYVNEEYGFSIKYPKDYVEEEPIEPECVFKAVSSARPPIPLPEVDVFVEDVEEGTTFADLRELTKADLETFGGMDIEFVSEKETTLADGTTPAHELVVEFSVAGAPRLKTLILSVIKENKWFSIVLIDMADYWPEDEVELIEVAYSLQFK